jgi:hypothetical protein
LTGAPRGRAVAGHPRSLTGVAGPSFVLSIDGGISM